MIKKIVQYVFFLGLFFPLPDLISAEKCCGYSVTLNQQRCCKCVACFSLGVAACFASATFLQLHPGLAYESCSCLLYGSASACVGLGALSYKVSAGNQLRSFNCEPYWCNSLWDRVPSCNCLKSNQDSSFNVAAPVQITMSFSGPPGSLAKGLPVEPEKDIPSTHLK